MAGISDDFEKYLAIETAGGPSWHPDGSKIAFAYNAPGLFQVYVVQIERNKTLWPMRVTFEQDRCTNPHYLSDGSLIFTRDYGGNENFQIGMIRDDMELAWLSTDVNAKHIIEYVTKKSFFFLGNIKDKSRFDIYRQRLPLKMHSPELLYQPDEGMCSVETVSGDEQYAILEQFFGNNNQNLLLLDVAGGEATNLTKSLNDSRTNRWYGVRWLDKEHILVGTDYNRDIARLAILSLSGEFIPIKEIENIAKHELEGYTYQSDSRDTYFTYNEGGYTSMWRGVFTAEGVKGLNQIELPPGSVITSGDQRSYTQSMHISHDHRFLATTMSSATSPTNVWVTDLEDYSSWMATSASTAGLNPKSFVNATLHNFLSFDSLPIPYFRYIPKGTKPEKGWPAILLIHGGPESQILPDFYPVLQFYLSSGFAVITPNIRGSTGYGRSYMDADNVEKRLDSIMDIKHLALHIKQNDKDINGDSLVVYGGSYGGFAVLSAMTEHPDLWKAGVDIVGVSNFVTFLENTASWRRKLREAEYGSLEHDRELLESISPSNKIDRISAPLFIIQGDNDERVPLSESIQIYESLKEKGLEVELMRFADEGHGLAKLNNRIKAYTRVVEWLQEIV
ncbi:MAG: S9 family peptidase [Candidatus Thorarchaeota archaeon]|jgi:dipeptidyl aminopeptidase/acylaminoacyl peptidase